MLVKSKEPKVLIIEKLIESSACVKIFFIKQSLEIDLIQPQVMNGIHPSYTDLEIHEEQSIRT